MSAGTDIKTWQERLFAQQPQTRDYPTGVMHECGAAYKDAEIAELRAALEAAKIPPDRLQNWIDMIHDNERSMGDRLQSLSSIFGGLLRGDALDKYPLQTIREQQPDSERDAALLDFVIENSAFIVWSLRDGSIKQCQLMSQDEDEDFHYLSGDDRYFNTPREAIEAAISVQQGEAQPLPGDKPSH